MQSKLSTTTIKRLSVADKPFEVLDTQIKGFLLRVQPSGRKTFYYSYRNKASKRKRIKIGVLGSSLTVQQARDKALEFASLVAQGRDIQGEKAQHRKNAIEQQSRTLEAFINDHYEPWIIATQKSGKETIRAIKAYFPQLLPTPLAEISQSAVEKYRTKKLKDRIKPSTINRRVTALRGLMSRAVEWDFIREHPLKKLKDLKVDKNPKVRYLTDEESDRLYAALSERDDELKQARESGNNHRKERGYKLLPSLLNTTYADHLEPLVILSLKTGLRRGELFELRWQDISFDNQQITVQGDNTKSSHTRHIPLSPKALAVLKDWKQQQATQPKSGDRVFPAEDGGRLDNVKKSWAGILKRAGISDFRWHDMRHDFASQLVMKGVPLNTVRELCGHASLDTTLRYAHLAPDHKAEAVSLLG